MQTILREKLLVHAKRLGEVSSIYRSEAYRFVAEYFRWLDEAEQDLSSLRSPMTIILQSEKSVVASVLDGHIPEHLQAGKSPRKNQRVVAAQSLERISREIFAKLEQIDRELIDLSEKLSQIVAIVATKEPMIFAELQADQHAIDYVWILLSRTPETVAMFNYLSARLARVDREYILLDIIQKFVSNRMATVVEVVIEEGETEGLPR